MIILRTTFFWFLLMKGAGLPNPDHCYDFTSRTMNDACGSLNLSKYGKPLITQTGTMLPPIAITQAASLLSPLTSTPPSPRD